MDRRWPWGSLGGKITRRVAEGDTGEYLGAPDLTLTCAITAQLRQSAPPVCGSCRRFDRLSLAAMTSAYSQRSQQLVRGVRRAFLLTITVTDSESLLPEIPGLPNLEGSSAE
jgi:hypothetical protein